MNKIILTIFLALSCNYVFCQVEAEFNPIVYTKPLPLNITVGNQPNDFKFTTHLVNIKISSDSANIWNVEMEKRYIKRLFNYIKDVDCIILNYSKFYFDESLGLGSIINGFSHEFNIQNKIRNIGLSLFNYSSQYNSNKLLQITRLSEGFALNPQIVTHEFYHLWNSFLESANYWLIDPSHHTGLVEENNSVFYGYRYAFEHVSDSIFSYKQGFCTGFPGKLEGYLAGLWDMPDSLKTLKNYYHYSSLPSGWSPDGTYLNVQVKADSIVVLNKSRLLNMYGGERIPNYINANNNYDCAVIVFSLNDFLSDDKLKGFHYTSILNEFEGSSTEYNNLYDQICAKYNFYTDENYGNRITNPYHSSYKKLHFKTRLFNDDGTSNVVFKPLFKGWTWFSLNSNNADMSISNVLSSLKPNEGDYIKNQTVSATYYEETGWFGELTQISPKEMYKIKLSALVTLKFEGTPADPLTNPMTINNGWNWIGYIPQAAQTIKDALSTIGPVANDYIKNQTKSSTYYEGTGWFGELTNLDPLDGYMLKTSHTATLTYAEPAGSFTDARDGKTYKWVKIGDQTWMAENLAYLPSVSPSSATSTSLTNPYYYVNSYEGSTVASAKGTANYTTYGVLYNWPAALTACPSGWHLPTDAEWTVLTDYLTNNGYGYGGSGDDIGKSMASTSGWTSYSTAGIVGNDQASNNSSGFTALPGGYRDNNGGFYGLGIYADFWSASESDASNSWERDLNSTYEGVYRLVYYKGCGFSVRCLQN